MASHASLRLRTTYTYGVPLLVYPSKRLFPLLMTIRSTFTLLGTCCLLAFLVSSCDDHRLFAPTARLELTATLSGAAERPPVTTAATGTFTGVLDRATRTLSYTVTYTGLTPVAGHLHRITGADGNGPVEIPFASLASPIISTATLATTTRVDSLIDGYYYVNLHTAANPGGEIRGDIRLATSAAVSTSTTLGTVLTSGDGKSLYFFAQDVSGVSNCTGNCANTWPPFSSNSPNLSSDFSTITRTDGSKQTTYKGWPLYNFRNDLVPGDVKGENVGNMWSVANPSYLVLRAAGQLVGNDGKNYTGDYKEGTGNTTYLTDSQGVTLYALSTDKQNTNTFTRADLSNNAIWPLFETSTLNAVPSALNKADFGSITVAGRSQVTYKGWPVYYFGTDAKKRGSTKGVSVGRQPGFWMVLTPTMAAAPL